LSLGIPEPKEMLMMWSEIFVYYILPIEIALILLEEITLIVKGKSTVKLFIKETSLYIGMHIIARVIYFYYINYLFSPIEGFVRSVQFFYIKPESIFYLIVVFIMYDFSNYWVHRLEHSNKYMWSVHELHHSSQRFHLMLRFRGSVLKSINNIPPKMIMILFGVDMLTIEISTRLNKTFQFFQHLSWIKSWGPISYLLVTPRDHIVHHAYNGKYLNKNFGATLMIWDHIFGTYQKLDPKYKLKIGTQDGNVGYNPFKVYFKGILDLIAPNK
jgi:sterol desaturase/sphingolipid hydroxylase (fatty acid hydroxylase superfamily)